MKITDNANLRNTKRFEDVNIGSVFKKTLNHGIIFIKVNDTDAYPFNNGNAEADYFESDIEVIELDAELIIKGIK